MHVSAKEGGYDQTLPDLQFEKADTAQSSGYVKVYPGRKKTDVSWCGRGDDGVGGL